MSEPAAILAKEALGLYQGLKELLSQKKRDPWDKETDFQRKNLRRRYLTLILVHPYAKESREAETHLWMQTSHAFIAFYKQKLSALDRHIRPQQQQQGQGQQQSTHGPVEYRKLLSRFRQFLADEEKFWTQLVLRLQRSFKLVQAQQALAALRIVLPQGGDDTADTTNNNGRNHYQFPPEDNSVAPRTVADRQSRLTIFSKALICLGDIARYRELYNEAGGRPRAGHDDARGGGGNKNRNRRGGGGILDGLTRMRNFDKAQECYQQARLLSPHDGNASHQLAILATYQKDPFMAMLHYYRALALRMPYDTASDNLGIVLSKALEAWKVQHSKQQPSTTGAVPVPVRIEALKEQTVVLHALWKLGDEKMTSHAQDVYEAFKSLVSERHLLTDLITKCIVLSQAALWKHRMIRDPVHRRSTTRTSSSSTSTTTATTTTTVPPPLPIESRIFSHVLAMHGALLEVGLVELEEVDMNDEPAQRITATFRRCLPALRVGSKWLRANHKYAMLNPTAQSNHPTTKPTRREPFGEDERRSVALFWEAFTRFTGVLRGVFPEGSVPELSLPLEEDVELCGFLPLRKLMGGDVGVSSAGEEDSGNGNGQQVQVHPNEEQLMRISDLLGDAGLLLDIEDSPMKQYVATVPQQPQATRARSPPPPPAHHQAITVPQQQALLTSIRDTRRVHDYDMDNMTETTSCTDDDPVRAAFRQALGSDRGTDDSIVEEEDEIVLWDPRTATVQAVVSTPIVPIPATPNRFPTPLSRSPITPMKVPNYNLEIPAPPSPLRPASSLTINPTAASVPVLVSAQGPGPGPISRPLPHQSTSSPLNPLTNNTTTTTTPSHPSSQPLAPPPSAPPLTAQTAQDLLNGVMKAGGVSRLRAGSSPLVLSHHNNHANNNNLLSTAPQPPLLFGSGPPNRPGHSIWSTSLDGRGMMGGGGGGGGGGGNGNGNGGNGVGLGGGMMVQQSMQYSPQPHFLPQMGGGGGQSHLQQQQQELSQSSIWSSPYNPQNSQPLQNMLPPTSTMHPSSSPFGSAPYHGLSQGGGHNRTMSSTGGLPPTHLYATPPLNNNHHLPLTTETSSYPGYLHRMQTQQQQLSPLIPGGGGYNNMHMNNVPQQPFYVQSPAAAAQPIHEHVRQMSLRDLRGAALYNTPTPQWGHAG